MNAVTDALREAGVKRFDMPASQLRVWAAIQAAKAGQPKRSPSARKREARFLYSRSRPKAAVEVLPAEKKAVAKSKFRETLRRHRASLLAALPGLAALLFVLLQAGLATRQTEITQEDIDAAVATALESVPIPSHSTKTYEAVRGSVVRVRAYNDGPDGGEIVGSTGTGVVILDKGVILTNIHVVQGARRISVTFDNGMESDAAITGTRPEDDLAVLQAATIPDDLQAATLQSPAAAAGDSSRDRLPFRRRALRQFRRGVGPAARIPFHPRASAC